MRPPPVKLQSFRTLESIGADSVGIGKSLADGAQAEIHNPFGNAAIASGTIVSTAWRNGRWTIISSEC